MIKYGVKEKHYPIFHQNPDLTSVTLLEYACPCCTVDQPIMLQKSKFHKRIVNKPVTWNK